MGLLRAEWTFFGTRPEASAIIARLRLATGMPLEVRGDPSVPDFVGFEPLREALLQWEQLESGWRVHGFVPRHPFVWDHLEVAMAGLGGTPVPPFVAAAHQPFAQPWPALSPIERWVLRRPALFLMRPFDCLLMRRRTPLRSQPRP